MAKHGGAKHHQQGKAPRHRVRRGYWGWILVIGAIVGFGAIATFDLWWPGGEPRTLAVSPEQVARGEAVFQKFCKDCHGALAQGENPATPQGGTKPGGYLAPALNATGHAHHHAPDVLFGYLRNGSPALDSPMRSFKDRLSEQDMRAVLGYVWSLWPESLQRAYVQAHGL